MNNNRRLQSSFISSDAVKLKISMVGNMSVGKTCLSLRFVQNTFREEHMSTISDIESKAVRIKGQDAIFQIWDTAGQERFRSLLPIYLKGIDGAVLAYDVTNRESFEMVSVWLAEVRKYTEDSTALTLAGNKMDKLADRQVTTQEAKAFAREQGLLFKETSAKSGENVDSLFLELAEDIMRRRQAPKDNYVHTTIDLNSEPTKHKCSC